MPGRQAGKQGEQGEQGEQGKQGGQGSGLWEVPCSNTRRHPAKRTGTGALRASSLSRKGMERDVTCLQDDRQPAPREIKRQLINARKGGCVPLQALLARCTGGMGQGGRHAARFRVAAALWN